MIRAWKNVINIFSFFKFQIDWLVDRPRGSTVLLSLLLLFLFSRLVLLGTNEKHVCRDIFKKSENRRMNLSLNEDKMCVTKDK